jgi:capsular polysaccharide export protein
MNRPRLAVLSRAICRIPGIAELADAELVHHGGLLRPRHCDAVAGWGRRPSTLRARAFAARHGLPFIALEDGFLRSVGLGMMDPPLSLVSDDEGIYYDASAPSRLDRLAAQPLDEPRQARALALIDAWRASRVSKYNHLREFCGELPQRYVLVADQTRGDASIQWGLADQGSFSAMLEAALSEYPDCTVLVKTHPDVFAGKARGCIDLQRAGRHPRVRILADNVHPVRLLESAACVYVATSQIGFEALLWGRPLRCFGMPFYAGRGLSADQLEPPAWRQPLNLSQLVHAALVDYPRYLDPETGVRCEVEQLLAHLGLQRRMRERFPARICGIGFSAWKRPLVRRFFQGSDVMFRAAPPAGVAVAVWGSREAVGVATAEAPLIRLEDGFLRSVGLGADLTRPLSWVADHQGIYYDATRPSALELLLQSAQFDSGLLRRAAALRQRIVAAGLTKYNVGAGGWQRPAGVAHVILVVGQVETDAAIALGAPGIRSNRDLLQAVRGEHPQACIVYKPHPDVVAGLRGKGSESAGVRDLCDEVAPDCPMNLLLEQVDEVHVISSLAGFEALLRGRKVVCHGQPFYAGWGLTEDRQAIARRHRVLGIDELVAACLILYPVYLSRRSGRYASPETALDQLLEWRDAAPMRPARWRRLLRFVLGMRARLKRL